MIAALLIWLAISAGMEANLMRSEVDKVNTGWVKTVNDMTGATQVSDTAIKARQTLVAEFVIGAVIMAVIGGVFMVVRSRPKKDSV